MAQCGIVVACSSRLEHNAAGRCGHLPSALGAAQVVYFDASPADAVRYTQSRAHGRSFSGRRRHQGEPSATGTAARGGARQQQLQHPSRLRAVHPKPGMCFVLCRGHLLLRSSLTFLLVSHVCLRVCQLPHRQMADGDSRADPSVELLAAAIQRVWSDKDTDEESPMHTVSTAVKGIAQKGWIRDAVGTNPTSIQKLKEEVVSAVIMRSQLLCFLAAHAPHQVLFCLLLRRLTGWRAKAPSSARCWRWPLVLI